MYVDLTYGMTNKRFKLQVIVSTFFYLDIRYFRPYKLRDLITKTCARLF